jgi:hypothetical protein
MASWSIIVLVFIVTSCTSNQMKKNRQNGNDQLAGMYKLLGIQVPDSTAVGMKKIGPKG